MLLDYLRRRFIMSVSYARSTYEKSQKFNEKLNELQPEQLAEVMERIKKN